MYIFIAVSILSGAWFVSPEYPTLAACRAAAVALEQSDPGALFEPAEVSDCFNKESKG